MYARFFSFPFVSLLSVPSLGKEGCASSMRSLAAHRKNIFNAFLFLFFSDTRKGHYVMSLLLRVEKLLPFFCAWKSFFPSFKGILREGPLSIPCKGNAQKIRSGPSYARIPCKGRNTKKGYSLAAHTKTNSFSFEALSYVEGKKLLKPTKDTKK